METTKRITANQEVINKWLPRFLGINIRNPRIADWSRRGDITVEYDYNVTKEDAAQKGHHPNKVYSGGQAYFTSMKKALQFIKEIEEANYIIPTKDNPVFVAECSAFGYIYDGIYKNSLIRKANTEIATFGVSYAESINRLHEWIKEMEHLLDESQQEQTYEQHKTGNRVSHEFSIYEITGGVDKYGNSKQKKVYSISFKDAKKYLI